MKHKFLVLGVMMSCLLGLTACGESSNESESTNSRYSFYSESYVLERASAYEDDTFEGWFAKGVTPDNFDEMLYSGIAVSQNVEASSDGSNFLISLQVDDDKFNTLKSGYTNWYNSLEEIGYNSPETLSTDIVVEDVQYYFNDDGELVTDVTIRGTKHSALMQIYFDNTLTATDIGVTVNKTTGEKLENAGLNTLLGMGMAFTILIIISLIISLFPLLFGEKKKKKESDAEVARKAMDNTINQIAEQEDLSNDAELVAVIAAAIAAYEGSASTEGFQVRSIRKVSKNWKR